ncbi:MAG: hypothetical protein ACYC7A_00890 [Thermoanaerobaculia bacterium]
MELEFVHDDGIVSEEPLNRSYDLFDRTGWEDVIFLLEEILSEGEPE